MQIKIESIDRDDIVLCRGYTGYRGQFSCSVACGFAIFLPYIGGESNLVPGNHIWVETDQQGVSEFIVLTAPSTFRLVPLLMLGDYGVTGQVEANSEDEVFYIDVHGFSFTLDIVDTVGETPKLGEWVSFIIHDLRLCDTNV